LSKPIKRKVNQLEFSERVFALQALYGKETAKKLGVSQATLNRYKRGESIPKQENYDKINRAYNRNKKTIEPERTEKEIDRYIKHRDTYARTEHHINAYDYVRSLDKRYKDFGIDDLYKLHDIADSGFEVARYGNENTVQFVIHGTRLSDPENREGKLRVIAVTGKTGKAGKKSAGYMPKGIEIIDIPTSVQKTVLKITPSDSASQINTKISKYLKQYGDNYVSGKDFFYELIGFYYKE